MNINTQSRLIIFGDFKNNIYIYYIFCKINYKILKSPEKY